MIAAKERGTVPTNDVVIECQEVRKTYETGKIVVEALRGVDLRVSRGEVVAVMGPSGCGKTTLLNCLSGLDDVSTGSVRIEGKEIARMDDNQRSDFRAMRMGFVFQNYNLMPVLTARENVELPLLLTGSSRADARKRAHESLKVMGLEGRESHRPAELSGGEQQRVAIARAFVTRPKLLLADEPTGNLDPATGAQVIELLFGLNRESGTTLLLVTHDEALTQRCSRVLRLAAGRLQNGQI
jgi:putative ABC transport system ATP-binding protein